MKKSKIVYAVSLAFNLLECVTLPFIIIATIFGVENGGAILVAVELAVLCATAVVANIAGGYNPKTDWHAVALPPITFMMVWSCILGFDFSSIADWWIVLVASVILLGICLTAFLLSKRRQNIKRKKESNEAV